LLYAQATDEIGDVVARLSADALRVAAAIAADSGGWLAFDDVVVPVHDWLVRAYGPVTADTSTVATCLRTGPIQGRRAPMHEVRPGRYAPDFQYRYLSEDVPYGLMATRALATLVGTATPAIDEVVAWAQRVLGTEYLTSAGELGPGSAKLPLPQNHGISTLEALLEFYRRLPTAGSGPSSWPRVLSS
jgi:hypothetical protein